MTDFDIKYQLPACTWHEMFCTLFNFRWEGPPSNQSFYLCQKYKSDDFLLITFFIYSRILFSVAFIYFTLNDRLLPNKNFERFSAIDWLQCIKACQNSPSLISFNYEVYNDTSCSLNECGFRDRCEALRNIVASPGAIFHQLKKVLTYSFCLL